MHANFAETAAEELELILLSHFELVVYRSAIAKSGLPSFLSGYKTIVIGARKANRNIAYLSMGDDGEL